VQTTSSQSILTCLECCCTVEQVQLSLHWCWPRSR